MSSNSWVFVDGRGEEMKSRKSSQEPETDFDLEAPLSDLVEKQRRMSRSSSHSSPSSTVSNDPETRSPVREDSSSVASGRQHAEHKDGNAAEKDRGGPRSSPPPKPGFSRNGLIMFALAFGALAIAFFMS